MSFAQALRLATKLLGRDWRAGELTLIAVAIARAFVGHPRLLFADEPTGNLDPATGAQVIDLLFELNRESGATLLLVTHDEALTQRCSRVLRLSAGRLVNGRL